jgi:hypothetical protein
MGCGVCAAGVDRVYKYLLRTVVLIKVFVFSSYLESLKMDKAHEVSNSEN